MCGEYPLSSPRRSQLEGSPPHVRRVLRRGVSRPFAPGITSACAESTFAIKTTAPGGRDHLRMCGEYDFLEEITTDTLGSPPHVRRVHCPHFCLQQVVRITSACAESTLVSNALPA